MPSGAGQGLSRAERTIKRAFDLAFSLLGLLATGWLILLLVLIASVDTGKLGLFVQQRVGRGGRLFPLLKIRTMRERPGIDTSVTTRRDPRITRLGRLLRALKLDELPQLLNVAAGQMSFVGPRPDVAGFADVLAGEDRILLSVRPGITSPATLRFRREEELLAAQEDPEEYNRRVIYPEKVRLNREYVENYSFLTDLSCLVRTVFGR